MTKKKPTNYWNHRLLAFPPLKSSSVPKDDEIWFEMYEVYYNNDKPISWCKAVVGGDHASDIKFTLAMMKKALQKPTLWGDERFPEPYT